jgi:hypothetical protein
MWEGLSIAYDSPLFGGVNECLKRKKKLKTTRVGTKKETTGSNSYCFFQLGEKDFVLWLPFS